MATRLGIGQMQIGSTFQVGGFLVPDMIVDFPSPIKKEGGRGSSGGDYAEDESARKALMREDDEILSIIRCFLMSQY
jgi:hypothetical protein